MFLKNQTRLELAVSDDHMSVTVSRYVPSASKWTDLSEKMIVSQLRKIGVRISIDHDLVSDIVAKALSGTDITGMTVLYGIPPRRKGEQVFRLKGNPVYPVFKGMIIGSLEKIDKDIPGKNVYNRQVFTGTATSRATVKIGKGCVLDRKSGNVLAKGYGQVLESPGKVSVKPLYRISPDKTRITAVIFHSDFYGDAITPTLIVNSLAEMNILEDSINHQAIESALSRARDTRIPQIVIVAKGRPPKDGKDGYFEPSEAIKPKEIDEQDISARVDHREQTIYRTVLADTYLGVIHPPRPGRDGFDVFGKIITSRAGRQSSLLPGEGVEMVSESNQESVGQYVSDDAGENPDTMPEGSLTSLVPGLVVIGRGRISVQDLMRIDSDIDYSTGNIRLKTGSVEITGSVRAGFVVTSPRHIIINKNVEDARVEAGGNIEVGLGAVMKGNGIIRAGGMLRCKFAENTVIRSRGSVIFSSNLNNCRIITKEKVMTNGKGIIMGGVITAEKSVDVNQIGSDFGIKTEIIVGARQKIIERLLSEKRRLLKHHDEIKDIFADQAARVKIREFSPEEKSAAMEVINTYNFIKNRINKIDDLIRRKRIKTEDARKYYVFVREIAYPGTVINIAGKTLWLHEPIRSTRIYYDPSKKAIVWN